MDLWTSTDPMTGQVVWQGHDIDIDDLIAKARKAQPGWAMRALAERVAIAQSFAAFAGNAVVFKPSELAPATAEFMAGLWCDAGRLEGVFSLPQGRADTGRALEAHPELDGLLFTGSSATGLALHQAFADRPDRILALETGGNNPLVAWNVVQADAPQLEQLFALVQECGAALGQDLRWQRSGGVCDGNNIAACGVPVIDTMGVRGGAIHSDREFLIVESLVERAQLSALVLMRLAAGV